MFAFMKNTVIAVCNDFSRAISDRMLAILIRLIKFRNNFNSSTSNGASSGLEIVLIFFPAYAYFIFSFIYFLSTK